MKQLLRDGDFVNYLIEFEEGDFEVIDALEGMFGADEENEVM
jgi:hypothetical protein